MRKLRLVSHNKASYHKSINCSDYADNAAEEDIIDQHSDITASRFEFCADPNGAIQHLSAVTKVSYGYKRIDDRDDKNKNSHYYERTAAI